MKLIRFLGAVYQAVFRAMHGKERIAVFNFVLYPLRTENPEGEMGNASNTFQQWS